MPLPSTALGMAVKRIAPSGRGISTWESTERYTLGISSGCTTVNFFAVKCPDPESSLRAIMVEPSYEAFLPTRIVVQAILLSLL